MSVASRLGEKSPHVIPQTSPTLPLFIRKPVKRTAIAHAHQVWVF